MGGQTVRQTITGRTLEIAYQEAVELANEEYGHQEGYSGQINSTCGIVDVTKDFKASKYKDVEDFVDNYHHRNGKHSPVGAIAIQEPRPNTNQIKTQVKHIVEKGTKKWALFYVVYTDDREHSIGKYKTKGDAVKRAREYTAENHISSYIDMEKHLVNSDETVARITYKPSSKERPGIWDAFGVASS